MKWLRRLLGRGESDGDGEVLVSDDDENVVTAEPVHQVTWHYGVAGTHAALTVEYGDGKVVCLQFPRESLDNLLQSIQNAMDHCDTILRMKGTHPETH